MSDAGAIERRVVAAIYSATVNRFEVEFEWPECHAKRCAARHGDPRQAFAMMKHQIVDAVQSELRSTEARVGSDSRAHTRQSSHHPHDLQAGHLPPRIEGRQLNYTVVIRVCYTFILQRLTLP